MVAGMETKESAGRAEAREKSKSKHPGEDSSEEEDESESILSGELSSQHYTYQNKSTGVVSTLNLRQMCLIACPPRSGVSVRKRPIDGDTLMIPYNPGTNSYDEEKGWQTCRSWSVLREACAKWHYQSSRTGQAKGPVTARDLAALLHSNTSDNAVKDNDHVTLTTKVWSAEVAAAAAASQEENNHMKAKTQWREIASDLELRMALQAFCPPKPPPSSPPPPLASRNEEAHAHSATLDAFLAETATQTQPLAQQQQQHVNMHHDKYNHNIHEDDQEFESDGGTHYIKHVGNDTWIKKKHVTPTDTNNRDNDNPNQQQQQKKKKKKRKRPLFAAQNMAKWIYVTHLPQDTNLNEVTHFFSKAGVIDLDPLTQLPRVKLYKQHQQQQQQQQEDKQGKNVPFLLKGDASICYARKESVELAIQILDGAYFRADCKHPLVVTRATFQAKKDKDSSKNEDHDNDNPAANHNHNHNNNNNNNNNDNNNDKPKRRMPSLAKRKVARLAAAQALDWDDGVTDNGRITGGRKGLRIVVLKHMFQPERMKQRGTHAKDTEEKEEEEAEEEDDDDDDAMLHALEKNLRVQCDDMVEEQDSIEKMTVFQRHPEGVVVLKMRHPSSATQVVRHMHGLVIQGDYFGASGEDAAAAAASLSSMTVEATYWDGVTDYSVVPGEEEDGEELEEMKKREDNFSSWLDEQKEEELPEELRLKVEGSG